MFEGDLDLVDALQQRVRARVLEAMPDALSLMRRPDHEVCAFSQRAL